MLTITANTRRAVIITVLIQNITVAADGSGDKVTLQSYLKYNKALFYTFLL